LGPQRGPKMRAPKGAHFGPFLGPFRPLFRASGPSARFWRAGAVGAPGARLGPSPGVPVLAPFWPSFGPLFRPLPGGVCARRVWGPSWASGPGRAPKGPFLGPISAPFPGPGPWMSVLGGSRGPSGPGPSGAPPSGPGGPLFGLFSVSFLLCFGACFGPRFPAGPPLWGVVWPLVLGSFWSSFWPLSGRLLGPFGAQKY